MFSTAFIQRSLLPLFIIAYAILSLYVMAVFLVGSNFMADNSTYGAPKPRPYAYRQMVSGAAHLLYVATPKVLEQAITPQLISVRDAELSKRWVWMRNSNWDVPPALSNPRIYESFVLWLTIYGTLAAFIVMFYKLTRALLPESMIYALAAPIVAMLVLVQSNSYFAYTYDYSELFFSCACLMLLLRQRWRLYLLCFALALWNKETAVFVIAFYAMWFYPRLPRRQYLSLGALQLLIYACVKGGLMWYFADRQGVHLANFWAIQSNILAMFGVSYNTLISIAFTVFLLTYQWQEKPAFLRGAMWMLAPHIPAFLIICDFKESRDWYWSLPVLAMLATHTLVNASGAQKLAVFKPQSA